MTQDEKSHKGSTLTVPHLSDRTVFRVFFAISGLMFLVNVARHWTYLEDDPLIVFRYAINFHAGYGWVMNPGEHVNGCTSWFGLFAATFLSSFLSVDSAIVALKLLGIMSGLVVLWKSQQIAALLLPEAPVLSACVPLLLSYRSDFCLSMTNGLETAFACAFLFCGLAAFLTGSRDNKDKTPWETVAFFVLAGLSRPELSVIYPSLFCLQAIKKEKVDLRLLGIYLLPFLCFAVFSFTFYHSILPNTYYAKRVDIPTGLILGSNYIVRYLLAPTYFLPAIISLACLLVVASRPGRTQEFFLATIAVYLVFLLRTSGDWMVDGRFAMPILPLVATSWLVGIHAAYQMLKRVTSTSPRTLAIGGLIIIAAAIFMDNRGREEYIARYSRIHSVVETLHQPAPLSAWMCGAPDGRRKISDWVALHVQPGQTVAMPEMGLISCLNPQIKFIDLEGLTDSTIARLPGYIHGPYGTHARFDWDNRNSPMGRYIESRSIDYVVTIHDSSTPNRNPKYLADGYVTAYVDNSGWHDFIIYKRI